MFLQFRDSSYSNEARKYIINKSNLPLVDAKTNSTSTGKTKNKTRISTARTDVQTYRMKFSTLLSFIIYIVGANFFN